MAEIELDLEADSLEAKPAPAANSPALAYVVALVVEWDKYQADKAAAEQQEKTAQFLILDIERKRLPDAMAAAGLTSFKTSTGRSITIETKPSGNIPALSTIEKAKGTLRDELQKRREAALAYVKSKWAGLLKTEVSVALGRGEAGLAPRIAELLREQFALTPEVSENVNPQTLNSHFRELSDQGKLGEVPADLFALYVGPIAKIK